MSKTRLSIFSASLVLLIIAVLMAFNAPSATEAFASPIDQPSTRPYRMAVGDVLPATTTTSTTSTSTTSTTAPKVPAQREHAQPAAASRSKPRGGSHRGYATAEECTRMVENGGDYGRSTNPNHFGRYQFTRALWKTFGGDPATWGHASAEEQDRVFATALAAGALAVHWLPYNGCG